MEDSDSIVNFNELSIPVGDGNDNIELRTIES